MKSAISILAVACVSIASTPDRSQAQIEFPEYGLGMRTPAEDCPETEICFADPDAETIGVYDVEVYVGGWGGYDGFRFTLGMPNDWEVLDYRVCGDTEVVAGDPFFPAETMEIATEGCWFGEGFNRAVMTLTIDCASPGALRFLGPDGDDDPLGRFCSSGTWHEADYGHVRQRVNVGSFCGRLDFDGPCEYCEKKPSASFEPSSQSWILAAGTMTSSTLLVRGSTGTGCSQFPECGQSHFDGNCFGTLGEMPDWITAEYLFSSGSFRHYYELTVDATGLVPGQYEGKIWAGAACPTCTAMCTAATLEVRDPSDAEVLDAAGSFSVRLSPNPVVDVLHCRVELGVDSQVSLVLFDTSGRSVATIVNRRFEPGEHAVQFDASELAAGQYVVRCVSSEGTSHQKVLIR